MRRNTVLKIDQLHFSFGNKHILHEISLEVTEGEIIGLIGPNGVGKTTLLRIIGGYLTPSKGTVEINGTDISSLRTKDKARRVAIVSQNPMVPFGFTVMETVLMGRNPHLGMFQWESHHDIDICSRAMALTRTLDFANRLLSSLSGGEAQRVFIARALSQQAPLLLLDEPTANLDLIHQAKVMDIICAVQKDMGGAVLVAMHDLTLAAQYCSRIALLSNGSIYASGSPQEVLTPQIIATAYETEVCVITHPSNSMPIVLPMAGNNGSITKNREPSGNNGHPPNKTYLQ